MLQGGDPGSLASTNPEMFLKGQQYLQKQQNEQPKQNLERTKTRIMRQGMVAQEMKALPPDQWGQYIQNRMPELKKAGLDTQQLNRLSKLSESGNVEAANQLLDKSIETANKIKTSNMRIGSQYDFGAPIPYEDDKGNVQYKQPRKNRYTGQVEYIDVDLEGKAIKETPDQKTNRKVDEKKQIEAIKTSEAVNKEEQISKIKSESIAKDEYNKLIANWNIETAGKYIAYGEKAVSTLRALKELKELNSKVKSAGYKAVTSAITDFLGSTPVDEGDFKLAARKFVLPMIGDLGANPTEGERAFMISIVPNLTSGNQAINDRLIDRFIKESEAQMYRGQMAREELEKQRDTPKPEMIEVTNKRPKNVSPAPEVPKQNLNVTSPIDFTARKMPKQVRDWIEKARAAGISDDVIDKRLKTRGI
jgi:hypothetical protein